MSCLKRASSNQPVSVSTSILALLTAPISSLSLIALLPLRELGTKDAVTPMQPRVSRALRLFISFVMGVRVLVRVAVSATAGRPGGQFASGLQSCQVLLHRLHGIGEVRGNRDDAARRHAGCKALTERSGNDHIDRVDRMRSIAM